MMKRWRINPSHVGARVNRGNTLLRFNRPADALASYDQALALMPGPSANPDQSRSCAAPARPSAGGAGQTSSAALKKSPEFPEAHFEAALAHLTLGDFKAGWKAYEWRWKTGAFADKRRSFRQPLWLGNMPLSGKTILLHAEQGFGDTLQFIRYAPLLASSGAHVICEVQPELMSLLSQLDGIEVVAKGCELPPFDLHCPLPQFPWPSALSLATIPAQNSLSRRARGPRSPLARPPSARAACAPASSGPARPRTRTMPIARSRLSRFDRLFENLPFACFSLQREMRDADREVLQGLPNL